jgi:ABC-type nitrate/sulfonate/bicarbonate transport system substrate-binding protein
MPLEYRTSCPYQLTGDNMQAAQRRSGCVIMRLRMLMHVLGVGLSVIVPLTCGAQDGGQAAIALRLGFNANSARNMAEIPNIVAQRKGFFAREGLSVAMVPLMGTTHMVAALDSGDVDATGTATPYMIEAALKGSDAVAVIGGVANTIYSLIAKPEIRAIAELKGKLVAISAPPDTITLSTRMLLAKGGLKEGDYRTKEIIGSGQRAECLASGTCDAVPLGQPEDIVFMRKGFRKLGDSLEVLPNLQFNVIAARRSWASAHKTVVVALARAFGDTFRYLRDPNERDDVAKTIVETTGASEEVARAVLALYYEPDRGVMPKQGEINIAGLAQVISLLGAAGEIGRPLPEPQRFVDLQYLQAAGLQ